MPDNPEPRRINFQFINNQQTLGDLPQVPQEQELNNGEENLIPAPRRRRNNMGGQVLDTIGIELESLALSRERVARILSAIPQGLGMNFAVHRDGSSEINAYHLGGNNNILVNVHTKAAESLFEGRNPRTTLGYELISIPMDIETVELSLKTVMPALKSNGDFVSERCATHIHVGGMKNLGFLKRELKLALWFDEVFYSLAHMDGKKFRGYSNNAIYARPLLNGPYFKYDRNNYQILNWEKALDAHDLWEFFMAYGLDIERGELPKYHPGRYFSINLYSVPRIGTVEFRHFNQTFNPNITTAVSKLCQIFVEIGIKSRAADLDKLTPGNPFVLHSHSYYMNKLFKFLDLANSLDAEYSLTEYDIKQLQNVMYNYKGIGIEDTEVYTHCRDFNVPDDAIKIGELKKSTHKPISAGNTDIHNIKYSSILGG